MQRTSAPWVAHTAPRLKDKLPKNPAYAKTDVTEVARPMDRVIECKNGGRVSL